jgi:hypothetical protein
MLVGDQAMDNEFDMLPDAAPIDDTVPAASTFQTPNDEDEDDEDPATKQTREPDSPLPRA